jgi:hypothetical protein
MPWVGFELMIPASERVKTVHVKQAYECDIFIAVKLELGVCGSSWVQDAGFQDAVG